MKRDTIIGSALVLLGILGYLTVADDLRHVGEFVGVTAIVISGLCFLAAGRDSRMTNALPLRAIALGILAGMVIGAALDNMFVGVGIGIALGTFVGLAKRAARRVANHHRAD